MTRTPDRHPRAVGYVAMPRNGHMVYVEETAEHAYETEKGSV